MIQFGNTVTATLKEAAMETVKEVGKQVGVEKVTSMISSLTDLEDNYEQLKQDRQKLLAIKDSKEKEAERNKQKNTTDDYSIWTNSVSDIAAGVENLITQYETERGTSNSFWWQHLSLSKQMQQKLAQVQQLIQEGRSMNLFLVDRPPKRVLKKLDAPKIEDYRTQQSVLEETLALLKNSNIKAIGVYGLKGVGKTAIMQNLNNNEEVAKLFDIVIFVTLSYNQDDHELQWKIAKRLKVDAKVTDDPEDVARMIHEELENQKYLLILDEVVDYINLKKLGIPDNDRLSKVVMTAQHEQACVVNEADRLIKVELSSTDEAWKMFKQIAGPITDRPEIAPIAQLVCEKCSCIPLLVHKIARSFKLKQSESSWRAGLEDLEERWPDYENEGENELYSFLTFCYDQLGDEKKQKCFLYASMYPANSKVYADYLVECWAAQDFLGDVNDKRKFQKARDRGHAILEHLTNVSLLEKGKQMIYITMNDCMRQLASFIISKHPECSSYIQTGEEDDESSKSKSWHNARWVSLIDNKLQDLPINQDCSKLLALLLQKNSELSTIPQTFFKKHMRSLLLLDLYGAGIEQMPPSISKLTNLKGLYLNDCRHLSRLPHGIRSLGLLEFLDIRGTKVNFIPSQIGYLANLRCLRIPYIKSGDQTGDTGSDAITKLEKLEELIIEVVSYQAWCIDAENVIRQLAFLKNLTNLRCSFPLSTCLKTLLRDRAGRQFTSFRFFVGCQKSKCPHILDSFDRRLSKYIRFENGDKENMFEISEMLPQTDAFELINCKGITELSDFMTESLKHISGFLIERCNDISTLLVGNQSGRRDLSLLPDLEQLHLINLINLNCAFQGPLHNGSLSKLKVLALKNCPSLKNIFRNGAIAHFSELQILEVQNCSEIEELVAVDEIGVDLLAKLEVLILGNLPRFRSVCPNQSLAWSSLEILNINGCPGLKSLPFATDKATNLRSIKGEQVWWDALQWTNKEHFHHLFSASFPATILQNKQDNKSIRKVFLACAWIVA